MTKLIKIGQKNTAKLDRVIKNQERLEAIVNEQSEQISAIKGRLDQHDTVEREIEHEMEGKGKKKGKKVEEFYHVNIHILVTFYTMSLILILILDNHLYYSVLLEHLLMNYFMSIVKLVISR